jgi:N6-adenosine-specific RNA methylase IME4
MFARSSRPGWDTWGSEVGLFDGGATPVRRWRSTSYPDAAEGGAE